MGEGVIVTDRDGRIVYANRAYADLIGRDERARRPLRRARSSPATPTPPRRSTGWRRRCARAAGARRRCACPAPLDAARRGRARAGTASGRGRCRRRPDAKALAAWTVADITARARAAGDGLPGAAARHRLSRPRAGRLLLGRAGRADRLSQRDARRMARHRPRPLRAGLADARRHRARRRRRAPRRRAGERTRNRTEIIDLDLVKQNGQSLPVRLLHRVPRRRRRRAGRDADAGAQPQPRRGSLGGAARRRGALHPLLQQHADRDRRGRPRGPHRPHQRAVPPPLRQRRATSGRPPRGWSTWSSRRDRPKLEAALDAAAGGQGEIPPIDAALRRRGRPQRALLHQPGRGGRRRPGGGHRQCPRHRPSSGRSSSSSRRARRCRRSASSPAASRTTSTTC